jgi:ankyrin repeat protein
MKLLLPVGADVNELECQTPRCLTPLIAAAETGQYEAAQLLLERGADVNKRMKRGQTALMFASDVNADSEGETALSWARQKRHAEITSLLISRGATR